MGREGGREGEIIVIRIDMQKLVLHMFIHLRNYHSIWQIENNTPSVVSTFSHAAAPPNTSSTSFNFGNCIDDT